MAAESQVRKLLQQARDDNSKRDGEKGTHLRNILETDSVGLDGGLEVGEEGEIGLKVMA